VNVNWAGTINQSTHNNSLVSVTNGHTGTLALSGALSASSGNGLQFDNADGTYNFTGTAALNGGDAAIDVIAGSGGTFSFGGGVAVTNPTAELVRIINSAPTFTYSGSFSRTSGVGAGILAQSNTGGTITFNGDGTTLDGDPADVTKSLSTGASAAISLLTNGGTTFNFAGGMALTTTSGAGFNATGGASALNVTGAGNTISSGTGIALNVTDTNIGASGLSFRSVSHSGGANGIVLSNTGSTNGLQVTGDGSTAGSGGSIVNSTGGDGATAGNGVYLNNARTVNLSWMNLSGHANNGVYANTVAGLAMNKLRITGNNGNSSSATYYESGVQLTNVSGTVSLTNSTVSGGAYNNMTVNNTSGAPNLASMLVQSDTFGTMQGTAVDMRNHSLAFLVSSGTANVQVQNSQFTHWWGTAVQANVQLTGVATVSVTNNNVSNSNPDRCCASSGIAMAGGALTYTIANNSVQNSVGAAIAIDESGSFAGTLKGTMTGNTIGTSGVANSGSSQGSAISVIHAGAGTSTHAITSNIIRQVNGSQAILLQIGDAAAGGGNGTYNATVNGNNIQEAGATLNSGRHAIAVTVGTITNDAHQACIDLGTNTITNFNTASAGNENRIRGQQRFLTTVRLPAYTGLNNDNTAVQNYWVARTTATRALVANNVAGGGGGFVNTSPAGSACPQP
jgi:hypothetical protein